ncbi:MAG: dTDP-4-dehydrorhamnose 3,5-epimerase [Burkholderiales bacterium]
MKVSPSATLPDVLIIELQVFKDERGQFFESYNERALRQAAGIDAHFVQDNQSRSAKSVLRGLHYQIRQPQGKLVRVLSGAIYDVAVDLRRNSANFGRWTGLRMSADHPMVIWIPPGFAHGFLAVSDSCEVLYKTTDYYAPEHERTLLWNDTDLAIDWPLQGAPRLSAKDAAGVALRRAETYGG